jgi:hypothetical protein
MTTTRDRLRDAVQWAEARGFSTPRDTLTLDDARRLDALVQACAEGLHVLHAVGDTLNMSEGDRIYRIVIALAAITQDDAGGRDG